MEIARRSLGVNTGWKALGRAYEAFHGQLKGVRDEW